jgi:tetratricopeptide (TPR) repeat protein
MSDPTPTEVLQQLLRTAAGQGQVPGPHPADDLEQLTVWALGQLPEAEENTLLTHLSRCGPCRRAVARLVRSGVLELAAPQTSPGAPETVPVLAPSVSRRRLGRRWWAAAGLALAASLLLAVGWLAWRSGPGSDVALARRAIAAGDQDDARERLERVLPRITDPTDRAEALQLLEQAGYALVRQELVEKNFDEVLSAVSRWRQLGVKSVRLDNLRLQAERRFPEEYALARDRSLLDYGYQVDGFAPAKALPDITDAVDTQLADWADLQARAGGDPGPALNRGQFLLSLGRLEDAATVFAAVLRAHPDNADAHTGLGLAAYQERDYPAARRHFEAAVRLRPDDSACQINLAMTLDRLNRPAEARSHWQKALEQTRGEEQRQAIRRHLQS